jgi:DNA-binding MarR family transcriptional regulator
VAKPKAGAKLSVFKGREAKLNRAIFQTLAIKSPQTIYDVHKQAKALRGLRYTRYASVNKRVKSLEESGYIRKTGVKKTKAGFEVILYELAARAYLVLLLSSTNLEELIMRFDDDTASAILALMLQNL